MAKEKEVKREHTLQMRVSDEEYSRIESRAKEIGLTISNYMRMVCLNCKIDIAFKPPKSDK